MRTLLGWIVGSPVKVMCWMSGHDPVCVRINRNLRYRCDRCKRVVFVE